MPETDYQKKKAFFDDMITLFGRKPVLEVLDDPNVSVYRLHLAQSNHDSDVIRRIEQRAKDRGIEVTRHTRAELSRISKNARQDQGVAIDIQTPGYRALDSLDDTGIELLLLDNVTNPQNLGMIIRSVAAAPHHGIVLPAKGSANIDPLVHKASAGTLFKANIFHTASLNSAVSTLKTLGYELIGLSGEAANDIGQWRSPAPTCFVLGNETNGLSDTAKRACDGLVKIPMAGNVESLNVAAAATLVSFRSIFD